jgi:hypothetical protein
MVGLAGYSLGTARSGGRPASRVALSRDPLAARRDRRSQLDDHLESIAAAVEARQHLMYTIDSSHMLATLCRGNRVRIGPRVSPRYLAGLDGTVAVSF